MTLTNFVLRSFFDPACYRAIGEGRIFAGGLKTSLYFFTIAAVVSLSHLPYFGKFAADFASAVSPKIPAFTLENGTISVHQPQPIIHHDQGWALVIDTTDSISTLDDSRVPLARQSVLVNSTTIQIRNEAQTQTIHLKDFGSGRLDDKALRMEIERLSRTGPQYGVVLVWIGTVLFRAFSGILLAVLTTTVTGIPVTTLFRLSLFALTPVFLVETLMTLLFGSFPFLASLLLSLFFFVFAVKSLAGNPPHPSAPRE